MLLLLVYFLWPRHHQLGAKLMSVAPFVKAHPVVGVQYRVVLCRSYTISGWDSFQPCQSSAIAGSLERGVPSDPAMMATLIKDLCKEKESHTALELFFSILLISAYRTPFCSHAEEARVFQAPNVFLCHSRWRKRISTCTLCPLNRIHLYSFICSLRFLKH